MATFTVNTNTDIVNANDGVLSLREAIAAAANLPGRDTIQLGTNVSLGTLSSLTAGNDIDFVGIGERRTLERSNIDRFFIIDGASVSFTNLTLKGGNAFGLNGSNGGGGGGGFGGALLVRTGNLFVNDVVFENNRAIGGNGLVSAGSGGRGGNDSGNGSRGGNGGGGANGVTFSGGGAGGSGGAASIINGGVASGSGGGRGGASGSGLGTGGGGGGGGGGGAGGAGAFRRGAPGAGGGGGGNGDFGGGGGGGGGGGAGGANVLGGVAGVGASGGAGGAGGIFAGRGGAGSAGASGNVTFDGDSPGAGGLGGRGGGGAGLGGAIFNDLGFVTVVNSRFVNNQAIGGTGFENGQGVGGAIFTRIASALTISGVTFESNIANSLVNIGVINGSPNVIGSPVAQVRLPANVSENSPQRPELIIQLGTAPLVPTQINFTVSGSAQAGQDFAPFVSNVIIPANALEARVPIQILDDALFDPNEFLTVTLTPGLGYTVSPTIPSATMVIVDNEIGGPIDPSGQWLGEGGTRNFVVKLGQQRTAIDFQGIGRGSNPSPSVMQELDTIQFEGADLVAKNLLLTQVGQDLIVSFDGIGDTQAMLKDFALENLDNLPTGLGNILFNGQTTIQDSFDVFNADETRNTVFNLDTVTFLNDLNNTVYGFDYSNDVINAQGGDDQIYGLGGNDILRGGAGKDKLFAGVGADIVDGGLGDDRLYLGRDRDVDTVIYRQGDGIDQVYEFQRGAGGDLLKFQGVEAIDVVSNGRTTLFRLGDGISGNAGFGSGQTLLELHGVSGFSSSNIGLNLASGNTARLLFA